MFDPEPEAPFFTLVLGSVCHAVGAATTGRFSCSQPNVAALPRAEMAISPHDEIQDDPPTLRPKAGKKEYLPPDVVWRRKWGLVLCSECGCHYTSACPTHSLPKGEVYPFDAYWRKG